MAAIGGPGETSSIRRLLLAVKHGLDPWESIPEDRLAAVARQCHEAEIGDILRELDVLARERSAVPEWNGDERDAIAAAQEMYARILARVSDALVPEVRRGLTSGEEETRRWVALALRMRDSKAEP